MTRHTGESNPAQAGGRIARVATLLYLLGTATLAGAEQISADNGNQEEVSSAPVIEETVVLGSLIPRPDRNAISPVYTIDRESLEIDGRQSIGQLLNRYPQFRPGNTSSFFSLPNHRNSYTSLNLRGLGPSRTLTLVNGRRLGPTGNTGEVDINILPVGLIENVDVLTGGASSVYGADAVAGVVNFALRDSYDGLELDVKGGRTDRNDGDTASVTLLGGSEFADGRGHFTAFLGYDDADSIAAIERDHSSREIEEDIATGELFFGGSPYLPGGLLVAPVVVGGMPSGALMFGRNGEARPFSFPDDLHSPYSVQDMRPNLERFTGGGFMNYEFNPALRLDVGVLLSDQNMRQVYDATPLTLLNMVLNTSNPLLTPETREVLQSNFGPTVIAEQFLYRTENVGVRTRDFDQDNAWYNLELSGRWTENWQWNLAYTQSDADLKLKQSGGASAARLQQALLVNPETGECFDPSGGCQPADAFGRGRLSPEAADFISEDPFVTREDTRQQIASFRSYGSWDIAGWRESNVAFGLEYRRDRGKFRPDERVNEATSYPGFSQGFASGGSDEVAEVYGELLVPVLEDHPWAQSLDLELGARYSDYSSYGGEWTWKSGLNWRVNPDFRLAGVFQRAARTPSLEESYLATYEAQAAVLGQTLFDPCAASNRPQDTPGREELCIEQGIDPDNLQSYEPAVVSTLQEVLGGNDNLDLETADTYSLRAIWTPEKIDGLSIALDYYNIDLSDYIVYLPGSEAMRLCFIAGGNQDYCQGIQRSAEGDITQWLNSYYNIGSIETEGYDLSLGYVLPHVAPWGWPSELEFSVIASKLDSWEVDVGGQAGSVDCAGLYF